MSISFLPADKNKTRHVFHGLLIAPILALVCLGLPGLAGRHVGQLGFVIDWKPCPIKRTIVFPKDYSLGELHIGPNPIASEEECIPGSARGNVVVPAGKFVNFIPAARFYREPSILNTISPDGIDCIGVFFSSLADAEDGICDKTLSFIGHLKGLIKLRLDRCDATDKGVAFARELPNLQMISAFQTSFEGKCFKALAGHQKLRCINMPSSGMKNENAQYFAGIPHLQFLNLCHSHINDLGVKNLSGCAELQYLDLADNPDITDQSIKPILALKNLRHLNVSNTSMTNLGAIQFKQLKLERLTLPRQVYKLAEMQTIRDAMPGTLVVARRDGGKKLDSETNKLFAPLH